MHEQWLDLIPFYVAGSLPQDQRRALEQHLRTCETCRREVREWDLIAGIVRQDADLYARHLPPLSTMVQEQLQQASFALNNNAPTQPMKPIDIREFEEPVVYRPPVPVRWSVASLAASVAVLLFVGALFIAMNQRLLEREDPDMTQVVAAALTQSVTPSASDTPTALSETATLIPSATLTETATQEPTRPLVTATRLPPSQVPPTRVPPTAFPPATATPVPPFIGIGVTPTFINPEALVQQGDCLVTSAVGGSVAVRSNPDMSAQIIATLAFGEQWVVYNRLDTWAQVGSLDNTLSGWAVSAELAFTGNCALGNTAIPTLVLPISTECQVRSFDGETSLSIYAGPGFDFPLLTTISALDFLTASGRSDNNWYRVRYQDSGIGWVEGSSIAEVTSCVGLPIQYSSTNSPTLEPTPTAMAPFSYLIGVDSYEVQTRENISGIAAGEVVRLTYGYYSSLDFEWVYGIATQDQRVAEARVSQLEPILPTPVIAP